MICLFIYLIGFDSLSEIKDNVSTINYQIENTKEKSQLDFKEVLNLQTSIKEQINSVQENITAINNLGDGWETNTKEVIHQCTEAKYDCFKTFDRWSLIWPGLNLWLSNDIEMNSTISALASQQGLIGEWVALRSIACEIKVFHSFFLYLIIFLYFYFLTYFNILISHNNK